VSLLIRSLELRDQDVLVHLNFLLTFLHGHLELVFAVFETVDLIGLHVDGVSKLFDFKLHAVVLDEGLLFALGDLGEFDGVLVVLNDDVLEGRGEGLFLRVDLGDDAFDVAALVLQLFVGSHEELELFLVLFQDFAVLLDVALQFGLFFLGALALSTSHFPLHVLDLEVSIVHKLALTLFLNGKFGNVGLQVARRRKSSRDVADEVGLLSAQFEQFLRFLEKFLLLRTDVLFNLSHHVFRLLELVGSMSIGLFEGELLLLLFDKTFFGSSVSFLSSIEPLHLFFEDFVDISNVSTFVLELSGKRRKLVGKNTDFTLEILLLFVRASESLTDFSKLALLYLNLPFSASVVLFLTLESGFVGFKFTLLLVENVLVYAKSLTFLTDEGIASS